MDTRDLLFDAAAALTGTCLFISASQHAGNLNFAARCGRTFYFSWTLVGEQKCAASA
jgi:hypothetical protein